MFITLPVGPMTDPPPSTAIATFMYGGLDPRTHLCLMRDVVHSAAITAGHAVLDGLRRRGLAIERDPRAPPPWPVEIIPTHQDALIDRARAQSVKYFLAHSKAQVLLMADHDIEWQGPDDKNYEGDLFHLARLAHETQSIVGAAVAKRVQNQGFASMIKPDRRLRGSMEITLGVVGLIEAFYIGAAFTAYPRAVLQAVTDTVKDIPPGYPPIFEPCRVPHPLDGNQQLALSEDWALCHRASKLGLKSYLATKPMTVHWGRHGYTVVGDAVPREAIVWTAPEDSNAPVYERRSKISLLHATRGRPEMAAKAYEQWMSRAAAPGRVEYIFSYDQDDQSKPRPHELVQHKQGVLIAVENDNEGCCRAYNEAAYASSGDILVQAHDDLTPPDNWDLELDRRLDPGRPQVLHVSDGLNADVNQNEGLLSVLIGTRRWFRQCGYFWHPSFASIGCDNDMQETATKHNVIIEATDLVFQHAWEGPDRDETQCRSYAPERWEAGKKALEARRVAGFPLEPGHWRNERPPPQ